MGTRGEERLKAITDAATEVVAERGYYGMTIQEVSDRVGITQAGLLKYVKNKNGLLMLVLRRYEDSSEAGDYIQSKLALTPEQRELSPLLMPEYYRTIAEDTMKRPQLTQLYLVLRAEAIDPNHRRTSTTPSVADGCARRSASYPWKLPPEYQHPAERSGCCRCASARPWRGLAIPLAWRARHRLHVQLVPVREHPVPSPPLERLPLSRPFIRAIAPSFRLRPRYV